ncbi:E3 ubiquitin-protein ligase ATL9, partial [Bienertia sinuspersici]
GWHFAYAITATIAPGRKPTERRAAESGLDAEEIESLPSRRYSEIKIMNQIEKGNKEELECAVCLAEFKDQEVVRVLPDCFHVFHRPLSQRFDHSGDQHDDDDDNDHDHVTVEIDGSSPSNLNSELNLDDVPRMTNSTRKLPRSYSTGDLAVSKYSATTRSNSLSSSSMPKETCLRSDNQTANNKEDHLSCISPKSDSFVDYSSLMLSKMKSTVISHETSSYEL